MIALVDFSTAEIAKSVFYGGDAGAKDAIIYKNAAWMLKYPKTTRNLLNPQVSYTTSPLSEYLGSKIYESLNIPVQETLLGIRNNKVVVACKDFTQKLDNGTLMLGNLLIPFHDLKNSFMSSDLESYSGSGSETLLDEVLATITGHEELKSIPGVLERFWDMFVVDAFIGNNDRNNGNWGILLDLKSRKTTLAPVYDNGNAFFNKRSLTQMEKQISDEKAMHDDAYLTTLSAHKYTGLDNEGHKINPFAYIFQQESNDCTLAVLRIINSLKMSEITKIITEIPEAAGNLAVMPRIQKEFYLELLRIRLNKLSAIK